MSARIALIASIVGAGLAPLPSFAAAGPWTLAPGEQNTEILSNRFTTGSFHLLSSDRRALLGGGDLEKRGIGAVVELGWKKRMSVVLGVPVQSVTRRANALPLNRTETGFGDGLFGLKYRLANGTAAAALELDWKAPLGYGREVVYATGRPDPRLAKQVKGSQDSVALVRQLGSPRLGDGQQDVSLALHVGTELRALRGFVQASGGYRYRFEEPADQFVASAELGFWLLRSLLVAGRYQGATSIGTGDRPTDQSSAHLAGPLLVYRIDSRLDVYVGSMHTVAAENAFHVNEFVMGFAVRKTSLNRLQGFLGGTQQR